MFNYLDKVTYSKVDKDEIEMQGFLFMTKLSISVFSPNGILALIKHSEIIMFYRKYAWKYWSLFIFSCCMLSQQRDLGWGSQDHFFV